MSTTDQTQVTPATHKFPSIVQHLKCWSIAAVGIIIFEIASTAQSSVEHSFDPAKLGFPPNPTAQLDFLIAALHAVVPGAILGMLIALKVAGILLIGPMLGIVYQFLGAGTLLTSQTLGRTLGEFTNHFRAATKPAPPQ
jgi:hypothetical protein